MTGIDWAPFDDLPESTCSCRCGSVFRSHAKFTFEGPARTVTRKPCPACHRSDDCWKISSDPETMTL